MNKRHLSLLAAASIALFSACSNTIENADSQARLNVLVNDANDGKPIAGAVVKLLSKGETGATNAEGIASFGGLSEGTHSLRVEKNGYASVDASNLTISVGPNASNEVSGTVSLDSLNAKLAGYAFYQNGNGNIIAANGATIRITLGDPNCQAATCLSLVNKTVDVTVGADGKYEFSGLPAVNVQSLVALQYAIGVTTYAATDISAGFSLVGNATRTENAVVYVYSDKVDAIPFTLLTSETIELADSAGSVVLTFSDSIDITKNTPNTIYARIGGDLEHLPADISYSERNTKVTIKPLGKWVQNFNVRISDLKSGAGKTYSSTDQSIAVSLPTPALSGKVNFAKYAGFVVSAVSSDFRITWDRMPNATGYRIYAKASKSTDKYKLVFTRNDNGSSSYDSGVLSCINPPLNISNPYENGGTVSVVVQAYNSVSETTLTDVTPVEFKVP
jgi:hypothetical protein